MIERALGRGVTARRFLAPEEKINELIGKRVSSFVVAPTRQKGTANGILLLVDPQRADSDSALMEIERTVQAVANLLGMLRMLARWAR